MELHVHLEEHAGRIIATTPEIPGCQGVGPDHETATARLQRVVRAYTERAPPSPFASVRKRLAEPGRGTVTGAGEPTPVREHGRWQGDGAAAAAGI